MAEKVTEMVLKVDLQCPSCHKKIKKILCEIPQIRGKIYDVKQNTVTINVVCCSPEKIRDKLCRKGGKVIKSIEIKETKQDTLSNGKPTSPEKPKVVVEVVVVVEKPRSPSPKKTEVVVVEKPILIPPIQARTCCGPCSEGYGGGPCYHGYPARSCYDGYYGYGYGRECTCGCDCAYGSGCHLRKCVCYIKENPTAECKIM